MIKQKAEKSFTWETNCVFALQNVASIFGGVAELKSSEGGITYRGDRVAIWSEVKSPNEKVSVLALGDEL